MINIDNSEHWILQQAVRQPDNISIKTDLISLTYKELHDLCVNAAVYFNNEGIKEKNHVGLLFNHSYKFLIIINTLWLIGAVPVPLNTRNSKKEVDAQLEHADIKYLILSESFSEKNDTINPSVKKIILPEYFPSITCDFQLATFNNNNTSLILFTSGSSGKPKAVVHTFQSLFESVKTTDSFSYLSFNDIWLASLPLYHIGGFMILLRAMAVGNPVVFPSSLKHENIVEAINKFQPSHFSLIATTLKRFLEEKIQPDNKIKYVYLGGGPIETELCTAAIKKGWPIVKVYGSTETCSMITALHPEELPLKPDSVGKPIGENKIKIADKDQEHENDQEHEQVHTQEIGSDTSLIRESREIVIQSESLFKEYYNDKLSTNSKLKEGFHFTGDFGWIDDEGYLYIESRREDLVITGGENVSTKEVEKIIKSYHAVTDVFVFGVPDKEWGQKLCAVIVADNVKENDLRLFLKDKIAGYKIPKEFFFSSEIPKTEMGKVNRPLLFKLLNLD